MKRYFRLTRTNSYSLLFALPLLVLYELGASHIARTGSGFRNGADVLLRSVLTIGGIQGTLGVTLVLIAIAIALIVREQRRRSVPLRLAPFVGMAVESTIYALMLGFVVGSATRWILGGIPLALALQGLGSLSVSEGVVLSIGAGLYEELVFRVILAGGLFAAFRAGGTTVEKAGVLTVLLSALIFSAFHYVGPYGDELALGSFVFRFLAGVVFSVLFLVRGFGITAWTHALYDVFLVFALNG